MSEFQEREINRITCPAKIRTRDSQFGNQRLLGNQAYRKLIRLGDSPPEPIEPTNNQLMDSKAESFTDSAIHQWPITTSGFFPTLDQTEVIRPFNKGDFLYDSWSKTDNEGLTLTMLRGDQPRRSQLIEFGDFDRNLNPLLSQRGDSSFDQGSRILSGFPFDNYHKDVTELTRENTFLQRTLQDKNVEIVQMLNLMNEERKVLERRILDLQFQLLAQKKSSDRTIETLQISLKNAEGISQSYQTEIKRLKLEVELSQAQKKRMKQENDCRAESLVKQLRELEITCLDLRYDLEETHKSILILSQQKVDFQAVILQLEEQSKYLKISMVQTLQGQETAARSYLEQIGCIQQLEEEQSSPRLSSSNLEGQVDSQQSELNQIVYLESLLKQYEQQLSSNKKKMNEQKKTITQLEAKLLTLQDISFSMDAVSRVLSETNEELVSADLRRLNSRFQLSIQSAAE